MKAMTLTQTGKGYIKDNQDRVISKFDLPLGEHPLRDEFTFVEVQDPALLDAIQVYKPPKPQSQIDEELIQAKIRELAVSEIKKSNPDFKDPAKK